MSKFKVGDKVCLKKGLINNGLYNNGMTVYIDKMYFYGTTIIKEIYPDGNCYLQVGNGFFLYSIDMLELACKEPKFKAWDRVKINTGTNYIKGKIVYAQTCQGDSVYCVKTKDCNYHNISESQLELYTPWYSLLNKIKSLFKKTEPLIINIKLKTKRATKLNFNN